MTAAPADYAAIRLTVADGIATLTLARPQVRNAIDDDMRTEMIHALEHVARDPAIRALVVTGEGKGFCAGGDVKGMRARLESPPGEIAFNGWTRQQRTHHAMALLHDLPKPTIAAVNGAATGLGCDLALCCDLVMAADSATFAMTYVLRGLIPDGGGMYFLPRRVGLARAKELIFTGRTLPADEALAIGMIERVVPADDLVAQAQGWAAELSRGSPAALALAKTITNKSFEATAEAVFAQGSQAQAICYTSAEHLASVAAFVERSARKATAQ